MTISIAQIRAARAILNWKAHDLAKAAGIGVATVWRLEGGSDRVGPKTLDAVRRAFECAGVIFIDPNGGGEGVRLKK